jgi:hypothetical protein
MATTRTKDEEGAGLWVAGQCLAAERGQTIDAFAIIPSSE